MTEFTATEKILYSLIKAGVAGVFAVMVLGVVLRYLLPEWLDPWPPEGHAPQGERVAMAIIWGLALAVGALVFRSSMKRLRERACVIPYCRKCGYNLTGNVSGICPECGERI